MSSADLVFALPAGGTSLVFGDDGAAGEAHYNAIVTATFPALTVSVHMLPNRRATVTAAFPGLTLAATAQYASHAARPVVGKTDSAWQRAQESETGIDSAFAETDALPAGADSAWQSGWRTEGATEGKFSAALRGARLQRASRFGAAMRLRALERGSAWQDGLRDRRLARRSDFAKTRRLEALHRSTRHQDADHRPRSMIASCFEQAVPAQQVFTTGFGVGFELWRAIKSRAQQAIRPPAGIGVRPTEPETPKVTPSPHLVFCRLADGTPALLFGDVCDTSPDTTIVVPVRRVYFMVNTQSLMRVSDGKEILGADLRLSIDVDSWVWSWSASVPGRCLADLLGEADEQIELQAQINGNAFRLVVEKVSRDRRFASSRLAVSGRGRAAWLADPYATVRSYTNAQAMLAQQLMTDALTENGVSLGWELDWQITDWLVPAGVWSQTGTPMDACLAVAEAAGAYIQAHPSSMLLRVLPRYPAAPWHWAELMPDIVLPEDVCVTEGIEWVDKPAYNTVFISGQEGGVLAHVTRAGTDGGTPAPMVTDPLIAHADAGRQRGLSILSDTGRQALISLSLPVLEETGIILPGKLVQYSENGNTHLGLARAVDVAGSFPKIRQTIRLETHVL